jgi:signal transduction histidine kinase
MAERSDVRGASTVVPVVLAAVAVVAAGSAVVVLRLIDDHPERTDEPWWLLAELVVGAAYLPAGAAMLGRARHRLVGALFMTAGATALVSAVARQYTSYAFRAEDTPGLPWLAAISEWRWSIGAAVLAGLLLPTLAPRPRRWDAAVRAVVAAAACCVALLLIELLTDRWSAWIGTNPLELKDGWATAVDVAGAIGRLGVVLAGLVAVALFAEAWPQRHNRDDPLPGWLLAGSVIAMVAVVPILWDELVGGAPSAEVVVPLLLMATVPLVVLGAVIEMVRGAPTGREIVSHRVLEWTLLVTGIVLIYTGVVAGLGRLVGGTGPTWFLVAATGLVAILIEPARRRARALADRLVYGSRDNALSLVGEVLGHVSTTDDGDELLPALAASLGRELCLESVVIDVARPGGWARAATYRTGPAEHEPAHGRELPLEYRTEVVGRLVVGWSDGPSLRGRDEATLAELAAPLALAVSWAQLVADLRRSSAAVVSAREEERRRLRRDLHDGLGPTLTGISLGLRTAVRQLERAGAGAASLDLLARLADEVDRAVAEVRRIVRDLRPSALDQLGLVGALTEFTRNLDNAVQLHVELPPQDPELPAAVEVAVYRIVTEALTNVVRHAAAGQCWLSVEANGWVEIDVVDDGRGIPAGAPAGIGMTTMRERAVELGGTVTVATNPPHGTHLHVHLPGVLP